MNHLKLPADPLLAATTLVLWFAFALFAMLAVLLAVVAPTLLLPDVATLLTVSVNGAPVASGDVPRAVAATAAGAGLCALAALAARKLLAILGSVAAGDPLTADNAARLTALGWIAAALSIGTAAVSKITPDIGSVPARPESDVSVDLSAILLVLLLFVLARVFRIGAAMRADLDGTV